MDNEHIGESHFRKITLIQDYYLESGGQYFPNLKKTLAISSLGLGLVSLSSVFI